MALTFPHGTVFLQSLGSRVAKTVTKPFNVPDGDEDIWAEIATNKFDASAKTYYVCFKPWMMMILPGNSLEICLQDLVTLGCHTRGDITSQER